MIEEEIKEEVREVEEEVTNKDYMLEEDMFDDSDENWELTDLDDNECNIPEFIPKEEDEGKIYLSDYELAIINLNAERHKVFEKNKKIIDMKKQLINVQKSLIDSKRETLERDEMIIEYHAIQTSKEHEDFKAESKQFLIDISDQYDTLKGKTWGYNPESGEIIVN